MAKVDPDAADGGTGQFDDLEWRFYDAGSPSRNHAPMSDTTDVQEPTSGKRQGRPRRATQTSLTAIFAGNGSAARVAAVRSALDRALDAWWSQGELPPNALLRDGLLVLEAGHVLDEGQCSLLLRTALSRQKGMLTALRHQSDPERSGLLLAEALLDPTDPLPFEELDRLRRQDETSVHWLPALRRSLQEVLAENERVRRARALAILTALDRPADFSTMESVTAFDGVARPIGARGQLHRVWAPVVLLVIAAVLVVGALLLQQRISRWKGMAVIPAGIYPISTDEGSDPVIELKAFAVDRNEITNQAYRHCYERGACTWPVANNSATRKAYFLDPAFDSYPVVNVTWDQARQYCASLGQRLPTAAEWSVAAGYAPATDRRYRYPWGDQFILQAANSLALGNGDTQMVGSFHPMGDSPYGLSDMAGNVAEWTATEITPADEPGGVIVKGGSYQDDAAILQVDSRRLVPPSFSGVWLGFRCAAELSAD